MFHMERFIKVDPYVSEFNYLPFWAIWQLYISLKLDNDWPYLAPTPTKMYLV